MSTGRSLLTLVVAHDYIYAIGGIVNDTVLSSVERYDPATDFWTAVEPMSIARSAAAAAALNDHIFVMGGATKINTCDTATVERFDRKTGSWTMVNELKT